MKIPKFNRTHEFFKALADETSFGVIAQRCGKTMETAEAWGREPESNGNPFGTGKKNPLDTFLRLLGMAHKEKPGLAREWASVGTEYVDFLDGKRGTVGDISVCELAAVYLREHAELIAELLHKGGERSHIIAELADVECAFNQLKSCIREEAKGQTLKDFRKPAAVHSALAKNGRER